MLRFLPNFCTKSKFNVGNIQFRKLSDKSLEKSVKESPKVSVNDTTISGNILAPKMWQKTILVWSKVYKSKDQIPKHVPFEAIDKAKNIVRIKISNYMILLTIVACIVFAVRGRRAAERGETISKMNLDWHRQIKEDAERESRK